jgi:hypothetical protein
METLGGITHTLARRYFYHTSVREPHYCTVAPSRDFITPCSTLTGNAPLI